MDNVITVKNMRESDAYTINTSVSGRELMKRAAGGVFRSVAWHGKIAVVCGSGNNGGDGYALAEILSERGFRPIVLRIGEKLSEDGEYYYNRCLMNNVEMSFCSGATDFSEYDMIVDCILGTGFSGSLSPELQGLIESINRSRAFKVSVDINSGLSGANGMALPVAVRSDLTVSIGYFKTGMFLGQSSSYIGALVNVDIGIKLLKKQYYLIDSDELSPFIGYNTVSLTAESFAREYALDEKEFWRSPIKAVSKESVDSGRIFAVSFGDSKLIVDQTYIYFCCDRVLSASEKYSEF